MRVIDGGVPGKGAPVRVLDGDVERRAEVICSAWQTHVFRGEATVRYADDGTLDRVALERLVHEGRSGA